MVNGLARMQERWKSYARQMETIVSSNDFLQLKSSSLAYGKSLYHIGWTPLSVTIFITHVRCVN